MDVRKVLVTVPISLILKTFELSEAAWMLDYFARNLGKTFLLGIFLMPSFLCYGYQGDGEKIIPNEPLIIEINLISLKTSNN